MSQNVKLRVADDTRDQSTSEQPAQKDQSAQKTAQSGRPNRSLPTVRISFTKQLDILRAYAAASGPTGRTVSLKEVSDIVEMAPNTISLANPFFGDVKLIQRSEGAGLTPAGELLEYAHAWEWDKDTAAHKLAPLLTRGWFWEALQGKLSFQDLNEDHAVTLLAEKSAAGPSYKNQLRMILDYLEAAGLIKRENGQVKMIKGTQQPRAATPSPETPISQPEEGRFRSSEVTTTFAQNKLGAINFEISVHVDMSEIANWQPARISAFFAGIAQVLSAKGKVEQESGRE